jgi:hypothetical protein
MCSKIRLDAEITRQPVWFELTDQTRQGIDEYPRATGRQAGQFLLAGRHDPMAD